MPATAPAELMQFIVSEAGAADHTRRRRRRPPPTAATFELNELILSGEDADGDIAGGDGGDYVDSAGSAAERFKLSRRQPMLIRR